MAKKSTLQVKGTTIRTLQHNGIDYICITDIARQKNPAEPKDVVKNWIRLKNTLEYLGLWEQLNNPAFKEGVSKCMPSFFYDKASTFPSRGFVMS